MRTRRAFTLIEMLLATVLAGLLMGAVLLMTTAIGRDRARVTADESAPRRTLLVDQFRWDLTNAAAMTPFANARALILVGHGGLDPQTLAPTGRLTRVVYEVRGRGADAALFRSQEYLDEPTRPERWTELVALDVAAFSVVAETGDASPVRSDQPAVVDEPDETPEAVAKRRRMPQSFSIPTRAHLRIQRGASTIDEELWLR